ncbi:hypothetical protein [Zoogloea sp.]|uniref:hypothetical protein n=1 Tax=Zoogloea sp. TaxID=49181 RepID=UPI00261AC3AC|nr:hypothetical protein [Zoogloea sp.]MDD3353063.1 hypothetical protein [Zoogloea sp.]
MVRQIALLLTLAFGVVAGAQACGDTSARKGKPDMSKPTGSTQSQSATRSG